MNIKISLFLNLLVFFTVSCGNEPKFSNPTINKSESACDHRYYLENQIQKTFSIVKTKVDFLFLWDNSTSMTQYRNKLLKENVNKNIKKISNDFDVHMLFAPIIDKEGSIQNDGYPIADNYLGLDESIKNKLILKESVDSYLANFDSISGSKEHGIERAISLIEANKNNGLFRTGAYTIIFLISSGDDTDAERLDNLANKLLALQSSLKSTQFRFISLVPHKKSCFISSTPKASRYIEISKALFDHFKTNSPLHGLNPINNTPDSFDACNEEDISKAFEYVNATIYPDDHIYNYWPIAPSSTQIDQSKIDVTKFSFKNNKEEKVIKSAQNGFEYFGKHNSLAIRRFPEPPGEIIKDSHFIKLNGSAEVYYPDYLIVKTQSPQDHFGYIRLQYRPYLKNLYLEIDNKVIPQISNDPNGWEIVCNDKIVNFQCQSGPIQQEVQIESPEDWPNYKLKGQKSEGYFIKLGKNVTYTNNSIIKVKYHPNSDSAQIQPGCIGPQ